MDRQGSSRRDVGRARRSDCPRSSHAEIGNLPADRDPVALVKASNEDRVEKLIPLRHSRMLESPFAFYRGSAMIHAADLAVSPVSGIRVQVCGDCHLMNFGGFASPERDLVFDVNDFDETFPAMWEWDVKRLCASLVLAARWRGFSDAQARDAVSAAVSRYREMMAVYAAMSAMDIWYERITQEKIMDVTREDRAISRQIEASAERARRSTSEHVYGKLTTQQNGQVRIVDRPPLLFHPNYDLLGEADDFMKHYFETLREDHRSLAKRFRPVDAAIKIVGVGSVGTRCFIMLLLDEHNTPLFLQIKEARRSVLQDYAEESPWSNNGERVVAGQRLLQAVSDIFLGWSVGPSGRDYYVRQLRDMKVSIDLETINAAELARYGSLCGTTLARAHAKAGEAPTVAGYLGSSDVFDVAIGKYSMTYADQVEKDYEAYSAAVKRGEISTELSGSLADMKIV